MTRKKRNSRRVSDEELIEIFSRLPTSDAVRCAALSRRHRRLICSVDFWLLHRRLGPPSPHPHRHIAYMASSMLPGGMFHEFHLAGYGDNNGQRRALIDREPQHSRSRQRYVGTCNGVVVLASRIFYSTTTVVLLNPAIADSEQEVGIVNLPRAFESACNYHVAGFGYGASSRRHKLLVTRVAQQVQRVGLLYSRKADLLVYTLGRGCPDEHRWREVPSSKSAPYTKINGPSVYLDGKIYLLADHSRVLAFDVDAETVTAIDLPGERVPGETKHAKSKLMEMSGRLCVATASGKGSIALWLLTADQQWERRCLLSRYADGKLSGGWDCGGVLLLFFKGPAKEPDLILYDTRSSASEPLHVPRVVAEPGPEQRESGHVFCWGYQPTLVTPRSIVGGGGARPLQHGGGVAAALNPVLERDVNTGRKRTLETVCFMDMLLHIMRQLPDKANDVVRECSRRSLPFYLG